MKEYTIPLPRGNGNSNKLQLQLGWAAVCPAPVGVEGRYATSANDMVSFANAHGAHHYSYEMLVALSVAGARMFDGFAERTLGTHTMSDMLAVIPAAVMTASGASCAEMAKKFSKPRQDLGQGDLPPWGGATLPPPQWPLPVAIRDVLLPAFFHDGGMVPRGKHQLRI